MRIAVIGAGGIGALLGASLSHAGQDVFFVARGAHLHAMKRDGLRIEGDRGISVLSPVQATSDPADIGPVDLVLVCVKLWDIESVGEQIRPLIGDQTAVIPLQNGVDASERLISILGKDHILGGVAVVTGTVVSPGIVRQSGTHHSIIFGEMGGHLTSRVERIREVCRSAGIDAKVSTDVHRERWEKFVIVVGASGVCSLTRRPIGELRGDPDIWPLFAEAMEEVVAVGRTRSVAFPTDVVEARLNFLRGLPPDWMPSMAVDVLMGKRLELPWLAGKVVEFGRVSDVPTPVNRMIHAALKPYAMGRES